ncbi:Fumarate hydratase class II [Botrimarina colliarenosi]|uniref:Fumarate hydratase class II n=1 Tax=Botrimarina colliarenosi TaxID=2528001 RepID=A0A5C6AK52_9BACT|nr:class II fumarate hydratase [Botrimarina colliarenosi]TWT99401.1 Fumarate hydratase class II [Botrimarina colliarenosi]
MTNAATRTERDTMGEMQVPADALYGASTARAVENFPVANRPLPPAVIHAFGHLKAACAEANKGLGKLDAKIANAIIAAADEVAQGKHDAQFPVDVYQTGSGTSTNMNANEVIAALANDKLGLGLTTKADGGVHPNDHVNMGQSSNDTFPTAMCIAATMALGPLMTALDRLEDDLAQKADQWDGIVKIGRTHLMDATPIRVGQVFSGYASQIAGAAEQAATAHMVTRSNLPIGGTAVGTGINAHPEFAGRVAAALTERLGLAGEDDDEDDIDDGGFLEAADHAEAQAAKDDFVEAHACLKTIAVALSKIANDIRWLGSGPRCGVGELILPAIQPGSSIMPGKVNPVICESAIQVACRVIGNDATVTMAGMGGIGSIFELNVAMPVMIDAFLESTSLLTNVSNVFVDKLLTGLEVNETRCAELLDASLMTITALAPEVGYEKCAALAKQAHKENKTIKQLVGELELMPAERLEELMDYDRMTRPDVV